MAVSVSNPVKNPGADQYYQQQLGLNLGNYNNIQAQYQEAQGNFGSQMSGVYAGYGALSQSVLDMLGVGQPGNWGVATPAKEQIDRQYAQSQGQNQQSLINSGLGNSTLLANVMNQGNLQAGQAYGNLGAQLSQTAAGYTSQIGLAGLGARQQGAAAQLGFAGQHEGTLGHFDFAPKVPLYGQSSYSNSGGGGGGYGGGGGGSHYGGDPFTANMLGGNGGIGGIGALGYAGGYQQPTYGGPSQAGPQVGTHGGGMSARDQAGWNLADSDMNDPYSFNAMWNYAEG